jgi:Glyoxalase-like domain
MLELDHVVIAAADLEAAAVVLEERYGLRSVEGDPHPDWGAANRIVPLGGAYLELVASSTVAENALPVFSRRVRLTSSVPRVLPVRWSFR